MNQILSTQINNNRTKTKVSSSIDIKKIVIFFAIAIMLFGAILLGKGAFSTYNNSKNKVDVEQTAPDFSYEQGDEDIKITIEHDKPITKIVYRWNDGQDININGNNRTSITQSIALPDGTNHLTIEITDSIASVAKFEKDFTKVEGDLELSFALVDNKIKITAKDTVEMSYLTYKWNLEDANQVEVTDDAEDKKSLEVEVEIPEGLNTLTVIATNKNGKTKTKKQDIEGIAAPKISVQQDGEYLIINVKDENIVTVVDFTVNNQQYRINLTAHDADYYNAIEGLSVKTNSNKAIVEMEYRHLMTEKGENVIKLTATNKKDAHATFQGKCKNS